MISAIIMLTTMALHLAISVAVIGSEAHKKWRAKQIHHRMLKKIEAERKRIEEKQQRDLERIENEEGEN